jgi:P-type E1-E2 ATPase
VIREANSIQIDAEDLVVGDLLVLNPGETLCVDGIIVGKSKVLVDESAMTGESEEFEKGSDNPFLISGTTVA